MAGGGWDSMNLGLLFEARGVLFFLIGDVLCRNLLR
jgi:hypothetical protein